MSGSVCLPQAPPFHLHNLLHEKINEDLVLDCHLPFLQKASGGGEEQVQGRQSEAKLKEETATAQIHPSAVF